MYVPVQYLVLLTFNQRSKTITGITVTRKPRINSQYHRTILLVLTELAQSQYISGYIGKKQLLITTVC
jgi:hypothetical protein